jgi:hypothetical protein
LYPFIFYISLSYQLYIICTRIILSQHMMATPQSQSSSSENVISDILKQGSERGLMYVSAGLVCGGLASIVLARGGGSGAARKVITAFGTGVGAGAAWSRCSIDIEEALKDMK